MKDLPYQHAHNATNYLRSIDLDKCDPTLGKQVEQAIIAAGCENPRLGEYNPQKAIEVVSQGMADGLSRLGLNMVNDPSMLDTPNRYAKMLVAELTRGLNYDLFPKCTATPADGLKDMVLVRNLQVMSLCEHHLQTIDGYAHIAYIPNEKLLGLSKFGRIVEFFSRRPQVQERLTAQIYEALKFILETEDVAVIVSAKHYCMKARGSMQHCSDTTTDRMGGKFFTNEALRKEVFDAIRLAPNS